MFFLRIFRHFRNKPLVTQQQQPVGCAVECPDQHPSKGRGGDVLTLRSLSNDAFLPVHRPPASPCISGLPDSTPSSQCQRASPRGRHPEGCSTRRPSPRAPGRTHSRCCKQLATQPRTLTTPNSGRATLPPGIPLPPQPSRRGPPMLGPPRPSANAPGNK